MNESKPSSGWNEAKPSFTVDDAMGVVKRPAMRAWGRGDLIDALDVLTAEVERLRARVFMLENTTSSNELDAMLQIDQLKTELAAAKASSVVPVDVLDCYYNAMPDLGDVRLICKSGSDAKKVTDWLRERMKDKTPPAA